MDRCALFVDAGYVLEDGALAVHGTRNRESVSWDYAGVLSILKNVAREHTGLPLLRCYWYEAPVEGGRSSEHEIPAGLPGVKLRLGKMKHGRREGVESEIRRDLTTLARNRAISDALVVSAEEDLSQVISDVQDLGLRVILVHIAAPGWTPAAALRQECDEIVEISAAHLRPSVELVVGAEPVTQEEPPAVYPSRPAANGHGAPGVIGQPGLPAGAHAAPPAIYTGSMIAEYQQAAQPENSHRPAAADVGGPAAAANHSLPGLPASAQPGLTPSAPVVPPLPPPAAPPPPPPAAVPPSGAVAPLPPPPAAMAPPSAPVAPPPAAAAPPLAVSPQSGTMAPPGQPAPSQGWAGSTRDITGQSARPPAPPQAPVSQPAAAAQPTGNRADVLDPRTGHPAAPGHHAAVAGHHAAAGQHTAVPGHHGAPAPQYGATGPLTQPGQPGPVHVSGPLDAPRSQQPLPQQPLPQQPPPSQPLPPPRSGGQHAGPLMGYPQSGTAVPGQHPQSGPPLQYSSGPPYQAAPPPPPPARAAPPAALPPSAAPRGFPDQAADMATGPVPAIPRPPTAGAPPGPGPAGHPPVGQPGQQLRGGPGGYPAAPPAGPADQRARQYPVQPGQPEGAPYVPHQGPHSGPQPIAQDALVPQPVAVSLADAVQEAHGEGFNFGQIVARDAPALWLEAVLARKPRMPSDLEAKLLQDSSLPIDALLHDEVRNALRRGFWDALERVRH